MSQHPRILNSKCNKALTNVITLHLHNSLLSINCKIYMAQFAFHFLTVWPTRAEHPLLD